MRAERTQACFEEGGVQQLSRAQRRGTEGDLRRAITEIETTLAAVPGFHFTLCRGNGQGKDPVCSQWAVLLRKSLPPANSKHRNLPPASLKLLPSLFAY